MRSASATLAAMLAALAAGVALAQSPAWEGGSDGLKPIPALSARVTDLTSTLSEAERASLDAKLTAFESTTGAQLAVLIVPSTQPEPIEAYSMRVADAWKIGRKGRDDGVLFLVAKDDRKLRLEVGYGLEGLVTDAIARRIIAEDVAPNFREGRYAAGIEAGVDRIVGIVAQGDLPPPEQRATRGRGPRLDFGTIAILALIVVPVVGGILKSIFGKLGGSTVGGGIAGAIAWFVFGSIAIAIGAAAVAWIVILLLGGVGSAMSGGRRGGGVWIPSGGGWGGGGLGGGGWSGGGGGFGGGGASGGW
jgi:uncharacterized protein